MKRREKKSCELNLPLRSIKEFNKKVCGGTLFLGLLVSLLFLMLGSPAISKGFLLGTCFSVINFILLSSFTPIPLGYERKRATAMYFGSILIRYIILAVPMVIAIKSDKFNLISTIIGIFSIQITIFSYYTAKPIVEKKVLYTRGMKDGKVY